MTENLQISYESVRRIPKYDLSFRIFMIQNGHVLTQQDIVKRTIMAQEFLRRVAQNPQWIADVWFSDESHFRLLGRVNKTHCVFWGSSKPDYVPERPLHSERCTIWMAVGALVLSVPSFSRMTKGRPRL